MATKRAKLPEEKEIAIIPVPKKELVLEGDPEAQLQFAMKAANALMKAVQHKPKPVMIRGEQYLEYGDWQTLARFFGATANIEWTRPLEQNLNSPAKDKTVIRGYEARATVLHQGQIISSAEAMCTRDERNWKDRDEFMLRSMAQTRAAAKALRNAYGWVAELAGMKATPAEEMDGIVQETPRMAPYQVTPTPYPKFDETKNAAPLSEKEAVDDEIADMQKEGIKDMLKQLGKPNSKKVVKELTDLEMSENNYDAIYKILKKKVEETDPLNILEID